MSTFRYVDISGGIFSLCREPAAGIGSGCAEAGATSSVGRIITRGAAETITSTDDSATIAHRERSYTSRHAGFFDSNQTEQVRFHEELHWFDV
jgi:hypothetical protein